MNWYRVAQELSKSTADFFGHGTFLNLSYGEKVELRTNNYTILPLSFRELFPNWLSLIRDHLNRYYFDIVDVEEFIDAKICIVYIPGILRGPGAYYGDGSAFYDPERKKIFLPAMFPEDQLSGQNIWYTVPLSIVFHEIKHFMDDLGAQSYGLTWRVLRFILRRLANIIRSQSLHRYLDDVSPEEKQADIQSILAYMDIIENSQQLPTPQEFKRFLIENVESDIEYYLNKIIELYSEVYERERDKE